MKTTHQEHSIDGVYSVDRAALHLTIVEALLNGDIGVEEPKSILLGGGSASGKSFAVQFIVELEQEENPDKEITIIDADRIKELLPEYEDLCFTQPRELAVILHDESSHISELAIERCIAERREFIYDGTMKNIEKYERLIKKLHEHKYKVNANIVDAPIELAIERNKERAKDKTRPRLVPEDILIETHKEVAKAFPRLKDLVDSYVLFDTSRNFLDIIARRFENEPEVIHDQVRLSKFLQKGKE